MPCVQLSLWCLQCAYKSVMLEVWYVYMCLYMYMCIQYNCYVSNVQMLYALLNMWYVSSIVERSYILYNYFNKLFEV